MTRPLAALTALLVLPTLAQAEVSVSMRAQPTTVEAGGQFVVKIEVSSDDLGGPEIEVPSFDDFEVVQQSVSRPMQFSFGMGNRKVRSSTKYTFVLRALRPGSFEIPPTRVRVGGKQVQSRPLRIQVRGAPGQATQPGAAQPQQQTPAKPPTGYVDGAEADPQAFIRTVVDKASPFVHEQVTVTIYLYTRERLRTAPAIHTEATTDGLWTRPLQDASKVEAVDRQLVNGVRFNVYVLRRFAAFPIRPGKVTIGPLGLKIQRGNVFDLFSGRGPAELARTGVPVELEVRALPEGGPDPATVAVGNFRIEAKLDRTQVATGDAVTLIATVRGSGRLTTVRLDKPAVDGLEVFDPQIKDLIESPRDLVGGTRIYEWLVVPQRPGTFEIPAFVVPTFDGRRANYGQARSAPLTLTAAGQPAAAPAANAAAPRPTEATPLDARETESLKLAPIRTRSRLTRRAPPLNATAHYPLLVASAPLAWLFMLVIGWTRARLHAARTDPSGRATRVLRAQLAEADRAAAAGEASAVYAAIAAGVQAALESALGEAIGSHTHADLGDLLEGRGIGEGLRGRILSMLERCDVARFSPTDDSKQSLSQVAEAARHLTGEIARAEVKP